MKSNALPNLVFIFILLFPGIVLPGSQAAAQYDTLSITPGTGPAGATVTLSDTAGYGWNDCYANGAPIGAIPYGGTLSYTIPDGASGSIDFYCQTTGPDNSLFTSNHIAFTVQVVCGNGACEAGEDCNNCPQDCGACGPVCGNGACEAGEDCNNCAQDCGACPVGDADNDGVPDDQDNCPDVSGRGDQFGGTNGADGCPVDSDGDGLVDGLDHCPFAFGSQANDGCPADQPPPAEVTEAPAEATEAPQEAALPLLPADGLCSVATLDTQGVNLRAGPSTEEAVIGTMQYTQTYTADAISADGEWYQLEAGGWAAAWVVRHDDECANLASAGAGVLAAPSQIDLDTTLAACPELIPNAAALPIFVQLDIASMNPDAACDYLRAWLEDQAFASDQPALSEENTDALLEQCPEVLPALTRVMDRLYRVDPNIWQILDGVMTPENACALAREIANRRMPQTFIDALRDTSARGGVLMRTYTTPLMDRPANRGMLSTMFEICLGGGEYGTAASGARDSVIGMMLDVGVLESELADGSACTLMDYFFRRGDRPDLNALFDMYRDVCGFTTEQAAMHVDQAITAGVDILALLRTDADLLCSGALPSVDALPPGDVPDRLAHCDIETLARLRALSPELDLLKLWGIVYDETCTSTVRCFNSACTTYEYRDRTGRAPCELAEQFIETRWVSALVVEDLDQCVLRGEHWSFDSALCANPHEAPLLDWASGSRIGQVTTASPWPMKVAWVNSPFFGVESPPPVDSDYDGLPDDEDACPEAFGLEADGCPTPLRIVRVPPPTVQMGTSITLDVTVISEAGFVTVSPTPEDPAIVGATSVGTTLSITGNTVGRTRIMLTANDAGGNTAESWFYVYVSEEAPNLRPVILPVADQWVQIGHQIPRPEIDASDPEGERLDINVEIEDPAIAELDSRFIAGRAIGTTRATATADDGITAPAEVSFMIHVVGTPPPTGSMIEPVPDQWVQVGETITVPVMAYTVGYEPVPFTAAPGDASIITVDPVESGVAIRGEAVGETWVILEAEPTITSRGWEQRRTRFNVMVTADPPNLPPVIAPMGGYTVRVGSSINVPVPATDPEGDPLTLSWTAAMSGAGSESTAGFLVEGMTLIVNGSAEGTADVLVTVEDDHGNTALQGFHLTVVPRCETDSCAVEYPPLTLEVGETVHQAGVTPYGIEVTRVAARPVTPGIVDIRVDGATAVITGAAPGATQVNMVAYGMHEGRTLIAEAVLEVTVAPPNTPPVIQMIGDQALQIGATLDIPNINILSYEDEDIALDIAPENGEIAGAEITEESESMPGADGSRQTRATIRLTGRAEGRTIVTLTAEDAAGRIGSAFFLVTVTRDAPNRPPSITDIMPRRVLLGVGDSMTVQIEAEDPDGDSLHVNAAYFPADSAEFISAEPGEDLSVTITALSIPPDYFELGRAVGISVTVEDDRGGVSLSHHIRVGFFTGTDPDDAPTPTPEPGGGAGGYYAMSLPDQSMEDGTSIQLDAIEDIEALDLSGEITLSATSGDPAIATVEIVGTRLVVTGQSEGGETTIFVLAEDAAGSVAQVRFNVVVRAGGRNTRPVLAPIEDQTTYVGETLVLAVSASDADGDPLALSARSDSPSIANARLESGRLFITGFNAGAAALTVGAVDDDGNTAETAFTVTVSADPPPEQEAPPALAPPAINAVFQASAGAGQPARLYMLNGDQVEPLLEDGGDGQFFPALDPAGDRVAFLSQDAAGAVSVHVYHPQTGALLPVLASGPEQTVAFHPPAWSPDGLKLLVTLVGSDGTPGVYTVDIHAPDKAPALLIENAAAAAFSPGGRYIAFERQDGQNSIYVAAAANPGAAHAVTDPSQGVDCFAPAFGPDSASLFFVCDVEGARGLYRYDAQGVMRIDTGHNNVNNPAPGPAFGFIAFDDGAVVYYGYIDGSHMTPMLRVENQNAGHVRW